MLLLNLQSKKVSAITAKEISAFVFHNQSELSNELKTFYNDCSSIIKLQLRKHYSQRISIQQVIEMAYSIEEKVLNSGAASFETIFI